MVTLVAAGCLAPDHHAPMYTDADMVGVWTGFSDGLTSTYRLELCQQGASFLYVKFLDHPGKLYKLRAWHVDDREVLTHVESIGDTEIIHFRLTIDSHHQLSSLIVGEHRGTVWKRDGWLLRKTFLDSRLNSLEAEMEEVRGQWNKSDDSS